MRGRRFVAERTFAREKMLHEGHDISCVQRQQIKQMVAEAMIEKAIREPQHMIDRAWAEAALPQKIGFEVAQKFVTLSLRRRKRRSCRHSYVDEMRDEQPSKIRNLDLAFRRDRQ